MDVPPTPTPAMEKGESSLYIGDLHPDVTECNILDFFADLTGVTSVRLCINAFNGRSLGYGYVNFATQQDAVRAIEMKNHMPLHGKAVRLMWSNRDPEAVKKLETGNLYVKNLVDSIDNAELERMFREFGDIVSCKVAFSEDGKSKGHGFVQFRDEASAFAAIEKMNGFSVGGKAIYVGKLIRKIDRILNGTGMNYTNLYVKNLDSDITEELLQITFSKFGKISSLMIAKDDNGDSKGFGFVNFEDSDNARQAVDSMNGINLGSKSLYVARAQKKSERAEFLRHQFAEIQKAGFNLYVKNIADDVNEEELKQHFSQCDGTITSAVIMRDDKNLSKGFGFVCFSSSVEASSAVATLHGHMFHGKPLYVAIAERKEIRKARLGRHFAQRIANFAAATQSAANIVPAAHPPPPYNPRFTHFVPPRPGLMCPPPFGIRPPGWNFNGFVPQMRPGFLPFSLPAGVNNPMHWTPNEGRINRPSYLLDGGRFDTYIPHLQQPRQSMHYSKFSNYHQQQRAGQAKNVSNDHRHEINVGLGPSAMASSTIVSVGTSTQEVPSIVRAASSSDRQKQIISTRLYPLVLKLKSEPDLAGKVTEKLMKMEKSQLHTLLESPVSLAMKVDEVVEELKSSI